MLTKKTSLLFALVILFAAPLVQLGCKKKVLYILSGAAFNKCGEPMANATLDIRQRGTPYYTKTKSGGSIGTVTNRWKWHF